MIGFLKFAVRLAIINFLLFSLVIVVLSQNKKKSPQTPVRDVAAASSNLITPSVSQKSGTKSESIQSKPTIGVTPVVKNLFAELSSHNTTGSCWIVYQGHIYDITPFFGSHPGGDGIMLKYCGQDATAAFDSKEKSPAMPHSGSAKNLLSQYLIQ